ncbi:enoyl-CoA hydratase/isomerase family protein [Paraflavitalea sp. CAU 1676]|uniref:enoyl-CoA hydratase/isomerase family protein n=1 Tax=Paraflavitalea sp. CAU 1676 TaxID=3032598 RepID=UPI0023D98C0E|nr:enoyl-CoA hydratase/isomerase family protein [Paraflavitalea sp. CAU 1676]MDF2193172.1 enoyl-CoA hydratase/isomerase family protein [Paraflavitalea sp. CAU 1676]
MEFFEEHIADSPLQLRQHNPGFWQVTIDAPPLNLFGPELLDGLEELVKRMRQSPELRVIVFDSAVEEFFIAHFDVVKGQEILKRKTASGIPPWMDVAMQLRESPVISIVSIRGRTRGVGIEFATACDLRFASEKAVFGQFEVGVSTIPGGGSMEFLPLVVGRARALELVVGADDIDAVTAEKYGLINRLLPDDQLDAFVFNLAQRISQFDPVITGQAKTMINKRSPQPSVDDLKDSRTAFIQSTLRPERKRVNQRLQEWGIQHYNDFELNVGSYLNRIGDDGDGL